MALFGQSLRWFRVADEEALTSFTRSVVNWVASNFWAFVNEIWYGVKWAANKIWGLPKVSSYSDNEYM